MIVKWRVCGWRFMGRQIHVGVRWCEFGTWAGEPRFVLAFVLAIAGDMGCGTITGANRITAIVGARGCVARRRFAGVARSCGGVR